MLTHNQVWDAIDKLAHSLHISVSALARKAGLDPTTFNRSKRFGVDGRNRWPSTESIAKILSVVDTSVEEFFSLAQKPGRLAGPTLPLIGLTKAGSGEFFDNAGFPMGHGWDEITFPSITGSGLYALEISDDSLMPTYRDGDIIVASPSEVPRRGDRIIVRTARGEIIARELRRHASKVIELRSLDASHEELNLPTEEVSWIARIIWCSQ